MKTGPMVRTREQEHRYRQEIASRKECPFCASESSLRTVYESRDHFLRIENIFGYKIWDNHLVADHQLIVPKRHITSLQELTDEEKQEYMSLIEQAELDGFNIYLRSYNGHTKSVAHHHTHLIKITKRLVKALFYVRKPHFLLYRAKQR